MTNKFDHVRAHLADNPSGHTCHWPGCRIEVPPAVWGCRVHWYTLPEWLRRQIWNAYREGQEETKTPSRAYVIVAQTAQDWIADYLLTHTDPAAPKPSPQGSLF